MGAPDLAVNAVILEAKEMRALGVVAHDVRVQLSPQVNPPQNDPRLAGQASIARVELGSAFGSLHDVRFVCPQATLTEPQWGCAEAQITARGSPIGDLAMHCDLKWNSGSALLTLAADTQKFAGGTLSFHARSDPRGWSLSGHSNQSTIAGLRSQTTAWFTLPAGIATSGNAELTFAASGVKSADHASVQLQLTRFNFGNDEATIVGENISAVLQLGLQRADNGYDISSKVTSANGQALVAGVLLDMKANALDLEAHGRWQDQSVTLPDIRLSQKNLGRVVGDAVLRPAGPTYVRSAKLVIEELSFPAAYNTFLQNALAAGDFGALTTTGHGHGQVLLADDNVVSADVALDGIDIKEQKGKFSIQSLHGQLHWLPGDGPPPAASVLEWQSGSAYGLSGGAAKFEFMLRGREFALRRPARVPIFDGALRVDTFAARELTTPQVTMQFSGEIEPISMPKLSKAFGWPELEGQLAGRIPRVDYRDKLLTFTGDVDARVFNGRVTGSNLRLKDPLGPWPRLFADVRARDLDMGLVTQTFSIGSITGKLEADILGLELFNWSPVAFDAALRTPTSDRGTHRISAKAVGSLSNLGGGGGGVGRALQSGAFKLFDEYDYARIGLRCKLANEVCLMSGLKPAGVGYYILQGKGLPHVDIIGNAGRVNWPQLVSQIGSQMRGAGQITVR